jgi:hypothetical protein
MRTELEMAREIGYDDGFAKGIMLGAGVTFISSIVALIIMEFTTVKPLDVYRGKTTLEITYRDSVAIDSTVVYKVR